MTGAKRRTLWIPAAVLAVVAAGQCGVAYALFTDPVTSGSATLQTAILAAPTVNTPTNAGCTASAPQQTNVANSWSGSAALDAAGNYLVSGYNILRSTSSAGAYSSAGSVSGGPPATASTDTAPSGATPPSVYVSSSTGATTQSINSSTYAATTVPLGGTVGIEPNALQVTPDGTKLIVAEGASHQVQIVSTATGAVTNTVTVPAVGTASKPVAVAISPDGSTAWIVDEANARVYPLTLATASLGTAITVGTQGDPSAMVVTPNGKQVFVADFVSHQVSAINVSTKAVTPISLGGTLAATPIALAVTPDSGHVYVADQANGQIDDISTSGLAVAKTTAVPSLADGDFSGGGDPNILAITPNGSKLYVASYQGGTVEDITVGSDALAAPPIALPPGGVDGVPFPNALALTPNGCQLYVNDYDNNKVDVISVSNDTVGATTPAIGSTGDPTGMSVTPNGAAVYVANYYDSTVSVISTSTNSVVDTPVVSSGGASPYAIAIAPSLYYYEVASTHGAWASAPSSSVVYSLGWDVGFWQ